MLACGGNVQSHCPAQRGNSVPTCIEFLPVKNQLVRPERVPVNLCNGLVRQSGIKRGLGDVGDEPGRREADGRGAVYRGVVITVRAVEIVVVGKKHVHRRENDGLQGVGWDVSSAAFCLKLILRLFKVNIPDQKPPKAPDSRRRTELDGCVNDT